MPCSFSSPESARNIFDPTPSLFPGEAAMTASTSNLPFFTSFNSSLFSRRIRMTSQEVLSGLPISLGNWVALSESNWVDSLISRGPEESGFRVPGGVCPESCRSLTCPSVCAGGLAGSPTPARQ